MTRDWPTFQLGTVEDLDTHLSNFDQEVPGDQYQVQVVPYGSEPVDSAWQPYPYRLQGLTRGRWDLFTLWITGSNARVLDHVGPMGQPSFEVL